MTYLRPVLAVRAVGLRCLLLVERLVKGPDVAAAEGARAPAFDELEEERAALVRGVAEDLEELPPLVAVGEHVHFPQYVDRGGDRAHPARQRPVVPGWRGEELNA